MLDTEADSSGLVVVLVELKVEVGTTITAVEDVTVVLAGVVLGAAVWETSASVNE